MSQRNETVYQNTQDWLNWLDTKRFLNVAPQKNILDRSESTGKEPDAPMTADLAALNIAIRAVMQEEPGYYVPFITVYARKTELPQAFHGKPVKAIAAMLGIERPAFYDRAHAAANRIHGHTLELLMIYNELSKEMAEAA